MLKNSKVSNYFFTQNQRCDRGRGFSESLLLSMIVGCTRCMGVQGVGCTRCMDVQGVCTVKGVWDV